MWAVPIWKRHVCFPISLLPQISITFPLGGLKPYLPLSCMLIIYPVFNGVYVCEFNILFVKPIVTHLQDNLCHFYGYLCVNISYFSICCCEDLLTDCIPLLDSYKRINTPVKGHSCRHHQVCIPYGRTHFNEKQHHVGNCNRVYCYSIIFICFLFITNKLLELCSDLHMCLLLFLGDNSSAPNVACAWSALFSFQPNFILWTLGGDFSIF